MNADTARDSLRRKCTPETVSDCGDKYRPYSQAGRRGFEPRLPLYKINNLQAAHSRLAPTRSQYRHRPLDHTGVCRTEWVGRKNLETLIAWVPHPRRWPVSTTKPARMRLYKNEVIEALAFPDAQFDLVLSTLMLHHLPLRLREDGAREIRRVLKPGGRTLVVDFAGTEQQRGLFAHFHHRHGHVKLDEVTALLSSAGMKWRTVESWVSRTSTLPWRQRRSANHETPLPPVASVGDSGRDYRGSRRRPLLRFVARGCIHSGLCRHFRPRRSQAFGTGRAFLCDVAEVAQQIVTNTSERFRGTEFLYGFFTPSTSNPCLA